MVFSVLGRRELAGRSGTILEGESGANDPVGIALMASLLAAGEMTGLHAVGAGVLEFVLQMVVGAAAGVVGGFGLLAFMRRVSLPSEGLYPLRALAGAAVIYAVATVAHGSGFLAVFLAGIILGDARAPYKAEIERFHSSLASLGEIVAFTVLGLTISLPTLLDGNAWVIGLVLAALLAFLVRPLLVGLLLIPVRLATNERIFVLWAGLKGAVPILLGTFLLTSGLAGTLRMYDVIFVVVAFSVIVQGGLVPLIADRVGLPMRMVRTEPWAVGLRLRHEPDGARHYVIAPGAAADGCTVEDLALGDKGWISVVSRDGHLVRIRGDTVLRAGDEVVVLAGPDEGTDSLFTRPA